MTTTLQQLSNDMADLAENAGESVLQVDARRRLPATGIAWTDKLIVSASHVVESDAEITVGLPDGESVEARLVGRDPRNDLALLRVEAALQPIKRAESDIRVGSLALALGRPRRNINASLGLITGLANPRAARRRQGMKKRLGKRGKRGMKEWRGRGWRKRMLWDAAGFGMALGGFIRTDLTMYPGFSGGPLLGADGLVYGMNTSGFAAGISIALPIATLSRSVEALLAHGKISSGYLGIAAQPVQLPQGIAAELQQTSGLLVVSVVEGSPAANANMLVGDILIALDEQPLEDVDELQDLLSGLNPGRQVNTSYVRGGVLADGAVTIGEK